MDADEAALPTDAAPADRRAMVVCWHDAYYDRLFRRTALVLRDEAEAEDVVQDTFRAAFDALASSTIEAPEAWLRRVSLNLALKIRRGRRRRDAALVRLHVGAAPEAEEGWTRRVQVREALGRLDATERALVVLHYWDGLSMDEIADALGMAAGTVKSRLSRTRDKLARSTAITDPREEA